MLILEAVSGLKVNLNKSSLSPVDEVTDIEELASISGCQIVQLPISYLGLPLGAKPSSKSLWNLVIEKTGKKLSSWKGRLLLKGGKLVILRNVLSSIPIHFLSLFSAPVFVANQIEKMQRAFLWNEDNEQRKINWVK